MSKLEDELLVTTGPRARGADARRPGSHGRTRVICDGHGAHYPARSPLAPSGAVDRVPAWDRRTGDRRRARTDQRFAGVRGHKEPRRDGRGHPERHLRPSRAQPGARPRRGSGHGRPHQRELLGYGSDQQPLRRERPPAPKPVERPPHLVTIDPSQIPSGDIGVLGASQTASGQVTLLFGDTTPPAPSCLNSAAFSRSQAGDTSTRGTP